MTDETQKSTETTARPSLLRQMLRSALFLSLYVLLGVGLLLITKSLTNDMIDEAEQANTLEAFNQVLSPKVYDNDPLNDTIQVQDEAHLGTSAPVTVYRARKNGQPAGLIMKVIAPNGYSGDIEILLAVFPDGRISGVRVLKHKETPGLGDKIELRKSNWILSFNGRKLRDDNAPEWRVKKDGGNFDQFTGATITPRAVVGAVRKALEYINQQGAKLYE